MSQLPQSPKSQGIGNLLSNVSPPTELPSFLSTPLPASQTPVVQSAGAAPEVREQLVPAQDSQQPPPPKVVNDPFVATEFTAAIPPSKDTSSVMEQAVEATATNFDFMVLNPEPVLNALSPLTQGGSNFLGWMKEAVSTSSGAIYKAAEKAKNTVVTTLDPQMKDYIYSGGEFEVLVASDKEDKIRPVRAAFQNVFGKATVRGYSTQPKEMAAQIVGFEQATVAASMRIAEVRSSGAVPDSQAVVAIDNFAVEIFPDQWFDLGLLMLTVPEKNITLKTFTQMTPIPLPVITTLKADTNDDYAFKESGFAVTVGQIMANNLQTNPTEWHRTLTLIDRSSMILCAATALASLYKQSMETNNF